MQKIGVISGASRTGTYLRSPRSNILFRDFFLKEVGVVSELILYHGYDHWGFSCMGIILIQDSTFYIQNPSFLNARFIILNARLVIVNDKFIIFNANTGMDHDKQYLEYLGARVGAYRNVWWSMANEWSGIH